jgi:putative transcriptional regulator
MRFSYNKLFKLLIDRGINKKTLREMSGISATSVAKLGKGGNVNTDVLLRICGALKCDIGDIMEFVDSKDNNDMSPPTNNNVKNSQESNITENEFSNH